MKLAFASIVLLALLTGCGDEGGPNQVKAADNTGRNVRDKEGDTLTPLDQKENEADVEVTAAIRRALTDEDALSVDAQNVKVITQNGVVTLRGPVKDQAEKERIESIAKSVLGAKSIINELEVGG